MAQWFIPWFGQAQIIAYSTLWRPNGRGLQSTLLKRSKDLLEYHGVCFSLLREESPQLGVSRPYKDVHKEARSKGGMSNAHKTHKSEQQHAHKSQQELATQLNEFTTQQEL